MHPDITSLIIFLYLIEGRIIELVNINTKTAPISSAVSG